MKYFLILFIIVYLFGYNNYCEEITIKINKEYKVPLCNKNSFNNILLNEKIIGRKDINKSIHKYKNIHSKGIKFYR